MQPRERFVRANGLDHHVLEWGDADARQAVVLCHGYLDFAFGFMELGPALARAGYRVIAPDFRGHGESGRVPAGAYYYFPDYVLDLHTLLPQLVDAPFHLLGHSMGSNVSAMFAACHPDSLRSLTLMEGLGPPSEEPRRAPGRLSNWLAQMSSAPTPSLLKDVDEAFLRLSAHHRRVPEAFLRRVAERATRPHPSGQGLTWVYDPLHRTQSPIAFDAARFTHCLAEITVPTLVLEAEHGYRTEDHEARCAQLPHAKRHRVAGAGHMVHWTHCEQVAALVLPHLSAA